MINADSKEGETSEGLAARTKTATNKRSVADARWRRDGLQKIADEIIDNARSIDPQSDERFDTETHHAYPITDATIVPILFGGDRVSAHRERDGRTLSILVEASVTFEGRGEGFIQITIRGDIESREVKSVEAVTGLESER